MPPIFISRFRIGFLAVVALCLLAAAIYVAPRGYSATSATGQQKSSAQQQQRDLQKYFRAQEIVRLDTAQAAKRVRETGELSIVTPDKSFDLLLSPHDMRAPGYRAEDVTQGVIVHDVETGPVRTYRGAVRGMDGALEARFTVDDETIEGMILARDETYFIESARKFTSAADASDFVLYKASDVIPDPNATCALTMEEKVNLATENLSPEATQALNPFRTIELATEADFEYVSSFGGAAAANQNILSVMNQVDGIYSNEIGLTFLVTFQHTWSDNSDPYNSSDLSVILQNEFQPYWNANFQNVQRDTAHMWTGKNAGGGLGYVGIVCTQGGAFSYAVSTKLSLNVFNVAIPAHEIGHNLGADHSDGQANCNSTIMQATATPSTVLTFCQFSRDQITRYVTANNSCMSAVNPIDDAQFFVRQHYADFLNRAPDTDGLNYWAFQIFACGSDATCINSKRISVSAAFFIELEFQQTGSVVYRMYRAAYGTLPAPNQTRANITYAQFNADRPNIIAGAQLDQSTTNFANTFVQRPQFLADYPSTMPNDQFVNKLFDRASLTPYTVERLNEIALMTAGRTRAQVLLDVINIQAFKDREYNPSFVLMQYFGYLRRDPDQGGYDFWLNVLNTRTPNNYRGMVCAFITSAEYQDRFSSIRTRNDTLCAVTP
ncbi:MAG: M12 family metallo-peptidase [Pyrinomonadaceae bacterium]